MPLSFPLVLVCFRRRPPTVPARAPRQQKLSTEIGASPGWTFTTFFRLSFAQRADQCDFLWGLARAWGSEKREPAPLSTARTRAHGGSTKKRRKKGPICRSPQSGPEKFFWPLFIFSWRGHANRRPAAREMFREITCKKEEKRRKDPTMIGRAQKVGNGRRHVPATTSSLVERPENVGATSRPSLGRAARRGQHCPQQNIAKTLDISIKNSG